MDKINEEDKKLLRMIGQRIAIRRNELNWSQEDLAENIGLSSRTIYTAENGIQSLRVENVIKICTALGISPTYLLTGELGSQENSEFQRLFKKFSPHQVKTLKDFIKNW